MIQIWKKPFLIISNAMFVSISFSQLRKYIRDKNIPIHWQPPLVDVLKSFETPDGILKQNVIVGCRVRHGIAFKLDWIRENREARLKMIVAEDRKSFEISFGIHSLAKILGKICNCNLWYFDSFEENVVLFFFLCTNPVSIH